MAKKDNEEIPFAASPSAGNSEKLKALQAAMDKIEKTFGKGSIMKMGDDNVQEVEVIPTGSIALNAALGVGGYPKGRIIETIESMLGINESGNAACLLSFSNGMDSQCSLTG